MGLALICLIIMKICKEIGDDEYLGDSEAGSSLPSADASETRLVLDNAIGNSHLAAQSGQEHNQLKIQKLNICVRRDF